MITENTFVGKKLELNNLLKTAEQYQSEYKISEKLDLGLRDELEEAEKQQNTVTGGYLMALADLESYQAERLSNIYDLFQNELDSISREFMDERYFKIVLLSHL
jgi:hypothetical protein